MGFTERDESLSWKGQRRLPLIACGRGLLVLVVSRAGGELRVLRGMRSAYRFFGAKLRAFRADESVGGASCAEYKVVVHAGALVAALLGAAVAFEGDAGLHDVEGLCGECRVGMDGPYRWHV